MNAPVTQAEDLAGGVSLDALFRANAAMRADAPALADPPDRASFTDGAPRKLTYAQADAAIERVAQRLRSFGLPGGSVVAMQLPNTIEAVVSLLATLRVGLTAVPVPMAWGRSDLVAALGRIEPKVFLSLARFGDERPAQIASETAAELFSLSFPCAFGADVPDGVIALDRDESETRLDASAHAPPPVNSDRIAVATLDAARHGYFAVGRSDAQWLAVGLATLLEAGIESGETIVTTLPPNSLAGLGAAIVPWLLSGGVLELVHSPDAIASAGKDRRTHLVAPAAALPEIARQRHEPLASCMAVHRGTRTMKRDYSAVPSERIVDLFVFGEVGMLAITRADRAMPGPIPLGPISAPCGNVGAPVVIETKIGAGGELLLRGPMVPRVPFPVTADGPRLATDEAGYAHTGFRCRGDGNGRFTVEAGADRVVTVGGLRFGLDDLASRLAECIGDAKVEAVEDPLLGERLRVLSDDPRATVAALLAAGHSPLVIEAVAPASATRRATG